MERRTNTKSSKGITLIALVISIIVMLILAGVSIHAVVGDNGVLGKATDAVYLQSAAVLEEYFNQLYAEGVIVGNEEGETPLATIMKNGYQHYFFSTSEGYCLKKNYTNSDTGETQTLVLYLVKKEQLPEEIRKQIKGADNLESRDYRKLNGVYGITSDLIAYYCQSGIDSMLGLTTSDLNTDSPDIVYADENSTLAQIINGDTASDTDALKYIYKDNNANTILYYVDLRNNTNSKYVDSLGECSGIRYLYMAGCSNIQNTSTIGTVLGNCGANYSINGSYGLEIISDTTTVLSLAGKTMTISEFEQLMNKSALTHLSSIVLKKRMGQY